MYRRILVPLEHSDADETILAHVRALARFCGARLVLIHVADGWVARNIQPLELRESEEMRDDRRYLEEVSARLRAEGLSVDAVLAAGEPADEIAAAAEREGCDLIAMATHGRTGLARLLLGSVAEAVLRQSEIPVVLVRHSLAEAA